MEEDYPSVPFANWSLSEFGGGVLDAGFAMGGKAVIIPTRQNEKSARGRAAVIENMLKT